MKKQAIILISIGVLLLIIGAYFAIFNATKYESVPWWCFVIFFLGIVFIPIGYAFFKVKKPRIIKEEEPEVVIVPPKKEKKKTEN